MTTASEDVRDVAIIGFGFGGLMVLANLVRLATRPMRIAVLSPDLSGHGLAYSTRNPLHLLNVPVFNMSAWAHAQPDFVQWLATPAAVQAQQELVLAALPGPQDFAPRALYAHYLTHLKNHALAQVEKKSIHIDMLQQSVQQMQWKNDGWILDGIIAAREVVLATGNEVKPFQQNPWTLTQAQVDNFGSRPIAIIGSGLTAIDTILTLRSMGYAGTITAFSYHGQLPQPHRRNVPPYTYDVGALYAQRSWSALMHFVREAARNAADWRSAVDALRPHTQALWQQLSPREQLRAARRLGTVWNNYRHRMAPEIDVRIQQEIAARKLRIIASHQALREAEALAPACILNCTGPQMDWEKSGQPLLQQLLRDGRCIPHPTRLGAVADAQYRVGEHLHAIGSLMIGQFWESVAVPELRVQAARIAETLCS